MSAEPIAEFRAIIPQIKSAILFGGEGDSQVKLECPDSERAEVLKLAAYAPGRVLRVTVSAEDASASTPGQGPSAGVEA